MARLKKNLNRKQVALLRRVKKEILAVPERLVMGLIFGNWYTPGKPLSEQKLTIVNSYNARNPYEIEDIVPECGSVGCIMGWAKALNQEVGKTIYWSWLCDASMWPTKLSKAYSKAKTAKTRAKLAGEAIDYFIEHDGQKKAGD